MGIWKDGVTKCQKFVPSLFSKRQGYNKACTFGMEAPVLDLNLSITYGEVSFKIHKKRDDFNFGIINSPILDGKFVCYFLPTHHFFNFCIC